MTAKLSALLKQFQENPDSTDILAQALPLALEYETSEASYQTRIDQLQSANRNLLKQIPMTPQEVPKAPEPPKEISVEDGLEAMKNLLGGE
jgi:hypothetical protein